MTIYKVKDYMEMSKKAANFVVAFVNLYPESVLGLATGSSPIQTYKNIIDMYNNGDVDFGKIKTANLDEYKGLTKDNDQSYHYFMRKMLFDFINIDATNTHIPDGMGKPELECANYEQLIKSLGGVDLQLLGIGTNGHIGFNEPSDHFTGSTNCANLSQSTIDSNKKYFEDVKDMPTQAYTMGIKTIMKSKKIVLIASGESKADAIMQAFKGVITPNVPASILQVHPDVTLIADEGALSKLELV